jgi:serine/threonine-protein kinase
VCDFGIAQAIEDPTNDPSAIVGTAQYFSPEQAKGDIIDGRSDLYAVGLLLYEMLLGRPPFDGEDSYAVGYKHVHEMPVAPDQVDTRIPAGLSAITMKCLSKQAVERYDRGFELADALIAFLGQAPGAELRAARSSRPSGLTPF